MNAYLKNNIVIKALFVICLVVIALITLVNCGGDTPPAPDAKEVQLAKLSTSWKCTEAIKDGVPQDGYDNFVLALSGTPAADSFGYACTGRPSFSPWPSGGLWTFGANVESDIVRDKGNATGELAIHYSLNADGNSLEITFTYPMDFPANSGRVEQVSGQWIVSFTK